MGKWLPDFYFLISKAMALTVLPYLVFVRSVGPDHLMTYLSGLRRGPSRFKPLLTSQNARELLCI